jgi:hypothetical protein
VPQEWLEQEPQPPPPDLDLVLDVPCPTSGVQPPARMVAFQIRLTSLLPQCSHDAWEESFIERSTPKTSLHFWQRYS